MNRPPSYNPEWQPQPQAAYPTDGAPYVPPQPMPEYGSYQGVPPVNRPQSYPEQPMYQPQQPMPPYQMQQPMPQYQYQPQQPMPAYVPVNVNVINTQFPGYYAEPFDPHRGKAMTARTMGTIAITIWLIPYLGTAVSFICAIIGLICGIAGLKSTTRHGSAVAGIVMSVIALAFFATAIIVIMSLAHAFTHTGTY